jgi:hypothetical protein
MLGMLLRDLEKVVPKMLRELEVSLEESLLELSQISKNKGNDRKTALEVFKIINKQKHQFLNIENN